MITKLGYFALGKRNLIILFFVFFIPTLCLSYFSLQNFFMYKSLDAEIASIESLAPISAKQRKHRSSFLTKHMGANPNYIEELTSSTQFLVGEKKVLEILNEQKVFREDIDFQKRKSFICSENKLCFQKDEPKQKGRIRETRYLLKQKVETDIKDVEHLLSNLEQKENIPQYLLYDFQMELTNQNTYMLNLIMLQREFLESS